MTDEQTRRIERLEKILEIHDDRLASGQKTFAAHEVRLAHLEKYQSKQNGYLLRLTEKFEEHCKWLNRWIYGIGVGVMMLLLGLIVNLLQMGG